MKHILSYTLSIGFILILFFPIINSRLNLINDLKSFENRKATSEPSFDIQHLDPYPLAYETFYNDHFNLRSRLIKAYNLIKLLVFKRSPMPDKVAIGDDGWLFQAGDDMNSFQGKNKLTLKELIAIKNELELRINYLEKFNCKFYLLIAPSKASIYSEKLGYEFQKVFNLSWGEQLISFLEKNSRIKCINTFSKLKANKNNGELYHKLDNHWNDLGAFYTANEVFKKMKPDFNYLDTMSLASMKITKTVSDSGNMQKMLGYLPMYKEVNISIKPTTGFRSANADGKGYKCPEGFAYPWAFEIVRVIDNSKRPKLLLISDSFGEAVFPFLAEQFSKSIKIFDAWNFQLNEEIVMGEKPDIMLLEVNEPLIRHIILNKNNK